MRIKRKAYCSGCQKAGLKKKLGTEKEVPPNTDWCPDCGHKCDVCGRMWGSNERKVTGMSWVCRECMDPEYSNGPYYDPYYYTPVSQYDEEEWKVEEVEDLFE